jgi:hypothetical protein
MVIKSIDISIGAQPKIPNICNFEKIIENELKTTMIWIYENMN